MKRILSLLPGPMLLHPKRHAALLLLLLAGLLSGCSWVGTDEPAAERTYPRAGTYTALPLNALFQLHPDSSTTRPAPGRYNVDAYATKLAICPEDAACFLPDAVYLGAARDVPQEDTFRLTAHKPGQFAVGARYVLSVEITALEGGHFRVRLLGYSRRQS